MWGEVEWEEHGFVYPMWYGKGGVGGLRFFSASSFYTRLRDREHEHEPWLTD